MAVRILVDSAADFLPEEAKELGVTVLPLKVIFGEQEYLDTVNLTHHEFYEKLVENAVFPTTCQVPPSEFDAAFEKATANGDSVVIITMSGKLSGTYQSACIAAQEYDGKVFVVDSENVAIGQRILTLRGLEMVKEGLSAQKIAKCLDEEKKQVRVLALLDTLEYLKKGGRISSAVAIAGAVLAIKPVVAVVNGEVSMAGKARGSKQGNNLLRELVEKDGINFEKPLYLAYSGLSDVLVKKYIEDSADLWEGHTVPYTTVGCTIGAHIGPGAVAVAFFVK